VECKPDIVASEIDNSATSRLLAYKTCVCVCLRARVFAYMCLRVCERE